MPEKKVQFEKECHASWQISSLGGTMFKIHCRNCGVVISSGGTPRCMHPKFQEGRISFTRSKKSGFREFVKNLFKTN